MSEWAPNIFEFLDYRAYLARYYTAAKENTRSFSYRWFSRKAGYSSPNFLKLIIDGKRNLSQESVEKFSAALDHDVDESRFFADLVAFAQADTAEERDEAYARVAGSRRFRKARQIDAGYLDYLTHWYYPAIRELAARPDFRDEPAWISYQLIPQITPEEAQQALDALLLLGLLVRDADGKLVRGDIAWTTGHEIIAFGAGAMHRQMLQRAAASIELVDRSYRNLSATTVCVSAETAADVKSQMLGFRERIIAQCDADESPRVVYQLNMQLFPLSDPTS
ncbi:MAG: hypothetical protein ACI81R_001740 [Bradymonadia bacterium]|jgi:uncharacterized protein (TIGR02147 family)